MIEAWVSIPGFDKYEVSDLGRVRSYKRGDARVLAAVDDGRGYRRVTLRRDGRSNHVRVHQLVLLAFIGPCPDGYESRHFDGDPTNNAMSNLSYSTSSINQLDKIRHGTHNMARKTHCKRGHPLSGDNVSLIKASPISVSRRCKTCTRQSQMAYRKKEVA